MAKHLDRGILKKLTDLGLTECTVKVAISKIRRENTGLTLNAAAQVYAQRHRISLMPKLDDEDRASLATIRSSPVYLPVIRKGGGNKRKKEQYVEFFKYPTTDVFQKKHIDEINITYNTKCYVATFLLCRKVIQNLIVDLLTAQFPPNKAKENKELYYDLGRKRFLDFSVILKNLYDKRHSFAVTAVSPIQVLVGKARKFTRDANDQTHSWFYAAKKKDLDDADIDQILSLIQKVADSMA